MEEFKKNVNKAVEYIESCWDENNPNDSRTFDERLLEGLDDLTPEVRRIVEGSIDEN